MRRVSPSIHSSTRFISSSGVKRAGSIGVPMLTVTTPGRLIHAFRGHSSPALCATGRTGVAVLAASQAPQGGIRIQPFDETGKQTLTGEELPPWMSSLANTLGVAALAPTLNLTSFLPSGTLVPSPEFSTAITTDAAGLLS